MVYPKTRKPSFILTMVAHPLKGSLAWLAYCKGSTVRFKLCWQHGESIIQRLKT